MILVQKSKAIRVKYNIIISLQRDYKNLYQKAFLAKVSSTWAQLLV